MSSKTCNTCGIDKPIDDYYKHPRCAGGARPRCKKCEIASQVAYQQRPEVKARKNAWARANPKSSQRIRDSRLWTFYRLRVPDYEALLSAQGNKCAVCPATEPGGMGTWHVDHDHNCCPGARSCGRCVRGLLCARCNPMLGFAQDDPEILSAAVAYLVNRNATLAIGVE